jgi:ferredoxin--NADP+ reductase
MLGTEQRPLRVAIVGAGPSGFYAADALFRSKIPVVVDAFDRLPTPYGLLRGGVAPDHLQMKTVAKYYERVAQSPGFSFFGHVKVGQDITIDELRTHYDAIVFACGAETDRKLGIPGEDLNGSLTATEFVGWYNGHPDYRHYTFDLNSEKIAIIGQGNVAIDVARILVKTQEELKASDIAEHALQALAKSTIKEIHLIGRRGPVQSAFTELEIKELGELEDCDVYIDPKDMVINEASQKELDDPANNKARKNMAVLNELVQKQPQGRSKKIVVRFFQSPIEIKGNGKVEELVLETNALQGEAGNQKAVGTGQTESLKCGIVFRSVGYRGVPIPDVPFDEKRGVFPNEGGRMMEQGKPVSGFYCVGWIKRGPSGVLGTNKPDATATIEALLADKDTLTPCKTPDTDAVKTLLASRNVQVVTFDDWKKLDEEEIRRGVECGRPRIKFTEANEMLAFLNKPVLAKP